MTRLIKAFTGTENLFINLFAATFLTLLLVAVVGLVSNLIINPSLFDSATFGGF